MPEMSASSRVLALIFKCCPDFVFDPGRDRRVFVVKHRVLTELEGRQMLVIHYFSKHLELLVGAGTIIMLKDLLEVLFAARVMLICRPIRVEFVPNFAVFFLLLRLVNERVREQLWPRKALAWSLVQQTL